MQTNLCSSSTQQVMSFQVVPLLWLTMLFWKKLTGQTEGTKRIKKRVDAGDGVAVSGVMSGGDEDKGHRVMKQLQQPFLLMLRPKEREASFWFGTGREKGRPSEVTCGPPLPCKSAIERSKRALIYKIYAQQFFRQSGRRYEESKVGQIAQIAQDRPDITGRIYLSKAT
ncbi:hypothetical protein RJ639_032923 [Escallonia herrerae]|uniref:Uncharacterized protein n=1 Tax=Escallonia herrerae TaxID=1293975 RepID=A0AA88X4B3_9ASTE|nr:hypothetical protein RJ639_032923 [Escallonia herrerae]